MLVLPAARTSSCGSSEAPGPSLCADQLFPAGSANVIRFPGTPADTADGTAGHREDTYPHASWGRDELPAEFWLGVGGRLRKHLQGRSVPVAGPGASGSKVFKKCISK